MTFANMATTYEDLVKCGYLEMKLPRKQRKMTQKVSVLGSKKLYTGTMN